jgi:hypothetical protein
MHEDCTPEGAGLPEVAWSLWHLRGLWYSLLKLRDSICFPVSEALLPLGMFSAAIAILYHPTPLMISLLML